MMHALFTLAVAVVANAVYADAAFGVHIGCCYVVADAVLADAAFGVHIGCRYVVADAVLAYDACIVHIGCCCSCRCCVRCSHWLLLCSC